MKKLIITLITITLCATISVTAFAANPITDITNGSNSDSVDVKGTYVAGSISDTVYSVNITWGSMEFAYTAGSEGNWNPESHVYDGATTGAWACAADANKIIVANHSNAAIDAMLSYADANGYDLTTEFINNDSSVITKLSLPTAEAHDAVEAGVRTSVAYMNITDGVLASDTIARTTLGTITITISNAD